MEGPEVFQQMLPPIFEAILESDVSNKIKTSGANLLVRQLKRMFKVTKNQLLTYFEGKKVFFCSLPTLSGRYLLLF